MILIFEGGFLDINANVCILALFLEELWKIFLVHFLKWLLCKFHQNQKIWLSVVLIMSYWISGKVSTIIWITSRYCSKILTCFLKKKSWKKFRYGWAFEIMQFWSKFGYILKYLRMKYFSFWIPVDPWIKMISNDNSRGCFWFHLKKFDTWHILLEDLKNFIFDL